MLNADLQSAAEAFLAAVRCAQEYGVYVRAHAAFRDDPGLCEIRKRYKALSGELQPKPTTGTLSQAEIDELRSLQNSLSRHAVTIHFVQARTMMLATLQECNRSISRELGFDFATAAASPSCCG